MDKNVLILSVGTRNKLINYFKTNFLNFGKVVVTDMTNLAPAIYEADKFYQVPRISDPLYISIILDICKKENISAVLSLIDPELSLLAKNQDKFSEIGVTVIGSSYELCEMSLNKWKMFNWLQLHDFKCAKTYISKEKFMDDYKKEKINFPVFVKPVCGSASLCVSKVYKQSLIDSLFECNENLLIQEFLDGSEIGADCYIDLITKEVVSIFTKKKILMRAGETDKAVSFKDEKLFKFIEDFLNKCGFVGQVDIDIFEINGDYYISEVNPRFGGGYPHAYECGCNHISMIKNNLLGIANKKNIGAYDDGIYMMKYNDITIKRI